MKNFFYLLLVLGFSFPAKAQWINSVTLSPTIVSSCDTVIATVNASLACGNSTLGLDSVVNQGMVTTIYINEIVPFICLPIIITANVSANLGYLPAGSDTIIVKLYKNSVYTETNTSYLTVTNSGNFSTASQNICFGDSAFLGGAWRTVPGVYVDTIQGVLCDTFLNTTLNFIGSLTETVDYSICQGDSMFLSGAWRNSNGTFIDSFIVGSNCDSIVTSQLTVNSHKSRSQNISTCQGYAVFAGGQFTDIPGSYSDTFQTVKGCDSVIFTQLSVFNRDTSHFAPVICFGQTYLAGGAYQGTSGTYYDYFTNTSGCDSLVVTQLTVNKTFIKTFNDTICEGDSTFFNGNFYWDKGIYKDSLITINGCDSILSLNLVKLNDTTITESIDACLRDSVFIGGNYITNSGQYFEYYVKNNGCDSSLVFNVLIFPNDTTLLDTFINVGDSLFAGGAFQTEEGVYYDSFLSVNGCDSTFKTILTVENPQGVQKENRNNQIQLFPNPNNGNFTILFKNQAPLKVSVFNILGKEILSQKVDDKIAINLNLSIKGIYLLICDFGSESVATRVVVY